MFAYYYLNDCIHQNYHINDEFSYTFSTHIKVQTFLWFIFSKDTYSYQRSQQDYNLVSINMQ
eukprot:m.32801 g.32801  ORF g.32801 m.32801 type:complete len:62 (+) comp8451_c0_seq2:938-1123(+)